VEGQAVVPATPSERVKVRRRAGRGRYDRDTIEAILDEGLVGHLAFVSGGHPYAIPMLFARDGNRVYVHGSPLSRLISHAIDGTELCLTVTLVDGLVLARSAFHHSINYRSVVVLGVAEALRGPAEKRDALRVVVEKVMPGRSKDARGPSDDELDATEIVALRIEEASAKIRTGPPLDAAADYELPIWAGEVPLRVLPRPPVADTRCLVPVPDYVSGYRQGHA
jgi:nitroimidazol reductase NimA-like FMN-containing flavoprotein (pyridoxamine 5'-phosphate oxidase superfamily)